jgi:hypothetical protein
MFALVLVPLDPWSIRRAVIKYGIIIAPSGNNETIISITIIA